MTITITRPTTAVEHIAFVEHDEAQTLFDLGYTAGELIANAGTRARIEGMALNWLDFAGGPTDLRVSDAMWRLALVIAQGPFIWSEA